MPQNGGYYPYPEHIFWGTPNKPNSRYLLSIGLGAPVRCIVIASAAKQSQRIPLSLRPPSVIPAQAGIQGSPEGFPSAGGLPDVSGQL
jgi:hypothetical protein